MTAPLRVVQWATGNTGLHALRAILSRDDMELVGLRVFSDGKDGVDAGDIAGMPRTRVVATRDEAATFAVEADCVLVFCADPLADPAVAGTPSAQLVDDMCRLLASGRHVVTTAVAPLTFPPALGGDVAERLARVCAAGNSAFIGIGIDPGFMNDWLPLALSGFCTDVRGILAQEILNYGSWNSPLALRNAGYGAPPGALDAKRGAAELLSCWGTAVKAIAAELDVALDDIRVRRDHAVAPFAFDTVAMHVAEGTVAAQRFAIEGIVGGTPVIVAEHVTRMHDDVAPDWPRLATGNGGFRIVIDGAPGMTAEVALGAGGDPCVDACHATAARAVNAVPLICRAPAGVHSQFTLPLIAGRGLLR